VDEHVESQLADGAVAFGTRRERDAADTAGEGLQAGHRGREVGTSGRDASGRDARGYCHRCDEGEVAGCGRWDIFPSVSPVHRRNDGIPFDVDGITIPFAIGSRDKFAYWRNESLKAYGNAIVPQVMYEIFRAIQQVEEK
jgi:DNA (cytosine-5)-methyltransferase 1